MEVRPNCREYLIKLLVRHLVFLTILLVKEATVRTQRAMCSATDFFGGSTTQTKSPYDQCADMFAVKKDPTGKTDKVRLPLKDPKDKENSPFDWSEMQGAGCCYPGGGMVYYLGQRERQDRCKGFFGIVLWKLVKKRRYFLVETIAEFGSPDNDTTNNLGTCKNGCTPITNGKVSKTSIRLSVDPFYIPWFLTKWNPYIEWSETPEKAPVTSFDDPRLIQWRRN